MRVLSAEVVKCAV